MRRHVTFVALFCTGVLFILQYKGISTGFRKVIRTQHWTNKSVKTILYWTTMFKSQDHYLGIGHQIFENCSFKNCFATYDPYYLPVEEYDALLFYSRNQLYHHKIPRWRDSHQVYIFSNLESPDNTPLDIRYYNNFYNWTMTYRSDSDIVRRYDVLRKQKTKYRPPSVADIQKRTKKIAWFVSDCKTQSRREKLAEMIRKVVPVDIYGECGELSCSIDKRNECYDMMERHYKFYLSFENSICVDYVTEKLYNVLKRNVVPIVYGGANYTVLAPPKSVINVLDFGSVDKLTKYIKYLDAHPEEYLKYFEWKKHYVVETTERHVVCDLCKKLNVMKKPKVYSDIYKWWFGEHKNKCFNNIMWNVTLDEM